MLEFVKLNLRWLTRAFLLALFSGFGQTFFISLFSDDIRTHFKLSNGDFGTIYMCATLCSAAVFLKLGAVVDRFPVATVSSLVLLALAIANVIMAVCNSVCHWLTKVPRKPEPRRHEENSVSTVRDWTRAEVLRDVLFWLASPAIFAPAFIATAIFFHHQHLIGIKNWPTTSFAPGFILLSIATIASKFCAGPLIDRYGAIRLLWTYHLPLGLACLLLGIGQGVWFICIAMPLIGISLGFAKSIFGTVWPELYGTKHLGSVRAIAVTGGVFASACGSGVTGWLIDWKIGFESQLVFMAPWCVFSTGTLFVVSDRMLRRTIHSAG